MSPKQTKKKFNIGDRVVAIDVYDGNEKIVGVSGNIISIRDNGNCAVEFDEYVGGHSLEGRCEDGYGWYVTQSCLDHLQDYLIQLAPPMSYDEVMA
jgi:hypothetical protein